MWTSVAFVLGMHENNRRSRVVTNKVVGALTLLTLFSGCVQSEERCEFLGSYCQNNAIYQCYTGDLGGRHSELAVRCDGRVCVEVGRGGLKTEGECVDSIPVSSCSVSGYSCVDDQVRICIDGQSYLSEDCQQLKGHCTPGSETAWCVPGDYEADAAVPDAAVPDARVPDAFVLDASIDGAL